MPHRIAPIKGDPFAPLGWGFAALAVVIKAVSFFFHN